MIWVILACAAAVFLYYKIIKPHRYFKDLGIPQNKQFPIFGDFYHMIFMLKSFTDGVKHFYDQFPEEKVAGIYQGLDPMFMVRDPELIKQLTVKDFDHFTDHRAVFRDDTEPLWTKSLFALNGSKWRDMRGTLSPTFTSSKMKMMYSLMSDCAEQFIDKILKDSSKIKGRDMKDLFTRYANDVIATTAFGVQIDSYTDKKNDFYLMGKSITNLSGFWKNLKISFIVFLPKFAQLLGLKLFPKEAKAFFEHLVFSTIKIREEHNIIRPDLIHQLMEARKGRQHENEKDEDTNTGFATVEESDIGKARKVQKKEELTDLDICAQAMVFFFAGFDSISTMMCFMAHEIAVNPDVQERLREEVDETLTECNGTLTYEALMKMKYLDMVVSETLRLWPGAVATDRRCTKPYTLELPGKQPVVLPVDSILWIPIIGIHRDPQYYPEPDRFDPERFSDENKGNIMPYTYLPFGVGPRNCIGSRFALLEIKIMFFKLLSKMELVPNGKTPIPMKIKKTMAIVADPGFFLDVTPRKP